MNQAKISIQHGATSLSAEGSETFVKEAMHLWDKLIEQPAPAFVHPQSSAQPEVAATTAPKSASSAGLLEFDNVFDTADEKIKIIAAINGKSKAEQTRNVALLTLFAHYVDGKEVIPSELIRNACVDQGCYDSTNFAGYLKSLKSFVVMNTKSGGQYDIKLTAPGRKRARELAEELQKGDE
ncbi:hypothetical protein [Sphingopyxis sp.]|uniref:hypothetical protein n=1 Tax=Sphingopyxis sp. TaxID=1908224 RepID=UPI002D78CD56|nr:hypothetical protein [Sphingopyxis sp.]HET6523456.1 hypothetical protein [Sphingopyxis sp.]